MTSFWSASALPVLLACSSMRSRRVDRLDRVGDRSEQVLEQLVLLLQHPHVGHHLPLFPALRGGRRHEGDGRIPAPNRTLRARELCGGS